MRRWLLLLLAAVGALGVTWWRRGRRGRDVGDVGDVVPSDAGHRETLVDVASEDSFPASDPPSYWGRSAD